MKEIEIMLESAIGAEMCAKIKYKGNWTFLVASIQSYGETTFNEALDKAAGLITMESTSPKILHKKILSLKITTS